VELEQVAQRSGPAVAGAAVREVDLDPQRETTLWTTGTPNRRSASSVSWSSR
jgi:hypothetical protein